VKPRRLRLRRLAVAGLSTVIAVRPARAEDAAAIARVHVGTWRVAYAHVFGLERLAGIDLDARTRQWERWLAGDVTAFVAERDASVVGFVWVGPSREAEDEAELYAIYVLPEAQGSGAGPALMDAGVEAMRASGASRAVLWVLEDNPRARRFYEREGWTLDGGRRSEQILGVDAAEVRYARNL
jgi:ribosomal protein S18 acetylase RimI-like enzyme